ncbi:MAG: hypothetical protein GF350_16695 [Chitinivibrionales bacterium]|nr:hypothetical protein [Chitinivibrionales bacterium]
MSKKKQTEVKCKVIGNGSYVTLKRPEEYTDENGDKRTRMKHTSFNKGDTFTCTLKEAMNWVQSKPFPLVEILDEDTDDEVDETQEEDETDDTVKGKDGIKRKG